MSKVECIAGVVWQRRWPDVQSSAGPPKKLAQT